MFAAALKCLFVQERLYILPQQHWCSGVYTGEGSLLVGFLENAIVGFDENCIVTLRYDMQQSVMLPEHPNM